MRNRVLSFSIPLLLFVVATLFMGCGHKAKQLTIEGGSLMLDSTSLTIASSLFPYDKIPKEYWELRMDRLSEMGINTLSLPLSWNMLEPHEDEFDFSGMNDILSLCRMAESKGLLIWLHLGPYTTKYNDMGGLPWWLLKDDQMRLRSLYPPFMEATGHYFRTVAKELQPMFLSQGGNIVLVQLEEADGLTSSDKGYIEALRDSALAAGFDSATLAQSVNSENMIALLTEGLLLTHTISNESEALGQLVGLKKLRPSDPVLCSDIESSVALTWGKEEGFSNLRKSYMRIFELSGRDISYSTSDMIKGCSFGHSAGAWWQEGSYAPLCTAYDRSFISVEGKMDPLYSSLKKSFSRTTGRGDYKEEPLPKTERMQSWAEHSLNMVAPLKENLPEGIKSQRPLTMERCGIGYGAVWYSTVLPCLSEPTLLKLTEVHDYAQIFVGGTVVGVIDRREGIDTLSLPPVEEGEILDILVDATGRLSNLKGYKDYKGLTEKVELIFPDGSSRELENWLSRPLPSDYDFVSSRLFRPLSHATVPGIYRTMLKGINKGDSYLYMGNWGKGEVWLNGHSLGRFWNSGPQQALFVPSCWLREEENELIVLDWIGPSVPTLWGIDYPVEDQVKKAE